MLFVLVVRWCFMDVLLLLLLFFCVCLFVCLSFGVGKVFWCFFVVVLFLLFY